MILAWQLARAVGWLKRLAIAAESISATQHELLSIERERTPARGAIRKAELDVASVDEWNATYREQHPELYADADGI
jgi:hypothetical protein